MHQLFKLILYTCTDVLMQFPVFVHSARLQLMYTYLDVSLVSVTNSP